MKYIESFGTATAPAAELAKYADNLLDTSVKGILKALDLRRPIFADTAAYGHFGGSSYPWEQTVSVPAKLSAS
jgi:S-adenosylmethionine synthetase